MMIAKIMEVIMDVKSTFEAGKELISDSTITAKIKAKFLGNDILKVANVHVETNKGVVKLFGELPSINDINQAIEIAENTDGVKEVISKIEITGF